MSRETTASVIRHVLTAIGAFLIGKTLFGTNIDESWWQTAIGTVMAGASVWWSIKDKTANIESLQGAVRQIATFLGGIFISVGWLKDATLEAILGVLTALLPVFQSWTARKKAKQLQAKEVTIAELKK